jgi:hypothetical protein
MFLGLRAGAAKGRITPPVGIPFLGHGYRVSEGIHDDLWARSLVLEDRSEKVAIIALDLCWPLPKDDYMKVRREVERCVDIKGENILVSATHSHSGPAFTAREDYPIPFKRQHKLIDPWVEALPHNVAKCVEEANNNLADAKAYFGKALMSGICYNRRIRIREGVLTHTESLETLENAVRDFYLSLGATKEEAQKAPIGLPNGPINPEVGVLRVDDSSGKPLALLVNYACHAVASYGPLISAGFPGFTSYFVEQSTGAVCLFTSGCGGDVRTYHRAETAELKEAYRIGLVLATAVLEAMRAAQPIENTRIRVAREIVDLNWRNYPDPSKMDEAIKEMRVLFEEAKLGGGRFDEAKRLYDELRVLLEANGFLADVVAERLKPERRRLQVELQAMGIGDVILITFPHEVSVEIGLALKKASGTNRLVPITLANGFWMYLIPKKHYEEGGYENAFCVVAPGSGELEMKAALKLIEMIKI